MRAPSSPAPIPSRASSSRASDASPGTACRPGSGADGLDRSSRRAVPGRALAGLLLAASLLGCASGGSAPPAADGTLDAATLNRTARGAITSSGNVQVRLVDDIALVTGNLESATDQRAIERALLDLDGVERVRMRVWREM